MNRFRRLRRWWLRILLVLVAILIYTAWPGRSTFTVSKETTFATEPLDTEGYVDYPAALNQRLSEGITPETNANVLIWQALGPHPESSTMPPEYFKWLGIESPPAAGEYFINRDKYFDQHLKNLPTNQRVGRAALDDEDDQSDPKNQWRKRISQATKWPWKRSEELDISGWLKRNDKALATAIAASSRPQYFNPFVSRVSGPQEPRLIGALIPNVQVCREVVNALCCRAMSRVSDGDLNGAWQDLLASQRLGRLVARGASMTDLLVGIALVNKATDVSLALLSHCRPTSVQALRWLADLQQLPPMPTMAEKLDLGERFMALDALMSIAYRGKDQISEESQLSLKQEKVTFWDRLFTRNVDWDDALRNANRAFDDYVAAIQIPDRAGRRQALNSAYSELEARVVNSKGDPTVLIDKSKRGEKIGNLLVALLLPALEKIHNSVDRLQQAQANLQIAVAFAAFRADFGRYPAHLDELAPKYLPRIPGDLYSGKPLIYRPTENGYLLYSIGVNGIDEDGHWMDDEPPGDDLRVRMPVSEPRVK